MKRRAAVLSGILLFCVLQASPALGADANALGSVQDVQGVVTVTREDGLELAARSGLELLPGDTLTTGEDGVVSFAFAGGDTFRLSEDSQVSLDELSSREEESPPLLRLALGFLWAKISPRILEGAREVVHTPTAVCGVRGTEFDVVVAEDSASALVVDEGTVEIAVDGESRLIEEGQGTEVDARERIQPPSRAPPRERRNWKKFRRERVKRLIQHLPETAPVIRKRFGRGVDRYVRFTEGLQASAARLQTLFDELKTARAKQDRRAVRRLSIRIRSERNRFVPKARAFRRAFNRMRVIGQNTHHLTRVYRKHRERYSPEERALIEPNLDAVAKSLGELRKSSQKTVRELRGVFRELRDLRRNTEKPGGRNGPPAGPPKPRK